MFRTRMTLSESLAGVRIRSPAAHAPDGSPGESLDIHRKNLEQHRDRELKSLRNAMEAVREAVAELEQRRRQSLDELRTIAVELAVIAAEHVIHTAIEADAYDVEALIGSAVAHLQPDVPAAVRLHPDDLRLWRNNKQHESAAGDKSVLTFVPDENVGRGGCHLESASGWILASDVAHRLAQIRDLWMENVDDTQIERRQLTDDAQSLRRFPDRRETA